MSNIFNLPDLGEGLPDAEIREWHVKVGDTVKTDQPLVSMETAKAVVEVPSPQDGVIETLYGNVSDIIITGNPLVAFASTQLKEEPVAEDQGTVVGHILSSGETVKEDFIIGSSSNNIQASNRVKATPAVKNLARQLGVDLALVTPTGTHGLVTSADVQAAASVKKNISSDSSAENLEQSTQDNNIMLIRGARRAMVQSMVKANEEVVLVSIFDDADIHAWTQGTDITVRLIYAMAEACKKEPALNAYYDHAQMARELHPHMNLGLAMDTPEGLFVPVIHQADTLSPEEIRTKIETLKVSVKNRDIPPEELKNATISLSNFGKFAGRYASPIVVPPMVAILGVGKLREEVVAHEGAPAVHKVLPLSLSFDHRAITGGEATRFLGAVIESLEKA
jgi:2-oxoisovalerate dehydrogenase E2 component (dihydrolipoyl transacylase)